MLLKEFFSKPIDIGQKNKKQSDNHIDNDLFWYIIDHDKLHKDYFFPIAKKIKNKKYECTPEEILELFSPMVVKGCREFYADKKMEGKLGKVFPKSLREELCKRLYDHYKDSLVKNEYKIG